MTPEAWFTAAGVVATIVGIVVATRAQRKPTRVEERLLSIESARGRERRRKALRADLRACIRPQGNAEALVIHNEGQSEARAIAVRLGGESLADSPYVVAGDRPLRVLGPGAEAHWLMALAMGSPDRFLVEIEWEDDSGEPGGWRAELTW